MKEYFPNDIYKTSVKQRKFFGDLLFFKSRIYFYILLLKRIISSSIFSAKKGLYSSARWASDSFDIHGFVEGCGGICEFSGLDNIRKVKNEPVVFIGNHMGLIETLLLPSIIVPVKPALFIIKDSLVKQPFFGDIMKATDPIVVGRTNPRDDLKLVLEEGAKKLKEGKSVIIFPQSTRSSVFKRDRFNSLGIKLAKNAGVKIVPIALKTDFIENGKHLRDFGKLNREKTVYIKFGSPVTIKENGKTEHEKVISFIVDNLKHWKAEVI
ncbi:MAG: lysophospholipid acyltransferase family protein [Acidobacteriota bacterium]